MGDYIGICFTHLKQCFFNSKLQPIIHYEISFKNYELLKSEIVQKISDLLTFTVRIFFGHTVASD